MSRSIDLARLRFADWLRAGDVVAWPQATGEPVALTRLLVEQRHELAETALFVGMTSSSTLQPEHADRLRMRGLNGAGTNRRLTAAGVLDVIPVHVSTVPELVRSRAIKVDVALVHVRTHLETGTYSLGTVADYSRALIESARLVIAHVNEALPRTAQDALVDASEIDLLVHGEAPVLEMTDPDPRPEDLAVAQVVRERIPDGATLQLGIGALPVAVVRALREHRDLGVHSGVIFDAIVELVEAGVITNAHKGCDAGAMVTGCLFGTQRLYRFADRNAHVHLRSVEYTHRQSVLAGVQRLITINSAVEVDLSGQANAEIANGAYLGAVGGQLDFVRGGASSPGGRSIIALSAVTPDGARSRIVPAIVRAPVTTPRSDIDLVATQHGVADLRGCSLAERARRMIAIADPRFRDELARAVREPRSELVSVSGVSTIAFAAGASDR